MESLLEFLIAEKEAMKYMGCELKETIKVVNKLLNLRSYTIKKEVHRGRYACNVVIPISAKSKTTFMD